MFNLQQCITWLKTAMNPDSESSPDRYLAFGTGNNMSTNSSGTLTGFTEVTATATNNYKRIQLNQKGLGGKTLLTGKVGSTNTPLTTTQTVTIVQDGTTIVNSETRTVALVQNTNEYIMAQYTGETGESGAGWGTVNAFVVYTQPSGGDVICYGTFPSTSVGANVVPIILKEKFNVTLG